MPTTRIKRKEPASKESNSEKNDAKPTKNSKEDKEEVKERKVKKHKTEAVAPPLPLSPQVDIIVFGSGETGQLGLGNLVLEKKKPGLVQSLQSKHVLKLAVGGMHVAVLIQAPEDPSNTSLWTWGCNDQKILGRETDKTAEDLSMVPGLVPILEGKHIVDVTTGDFHMLARDSNGRVHVWGTYKDAENFIGFSTKQKTEQSEPILLEDLKGVTVTQIASGSNHSLALSSRGEVFEWGFVWLGQRKVTDRNRKTYLKPARLFFQQKPTPKIISISAAGYHSFAVSEDGRVFAWGLNNAGQLGIGDDEVHTGIVEITSLRDKGIISVIGGQHHSLALSNSGTVYSFGRGCYGQLGHGATDNIFVPTEIKQFVEEGDKVVKIGAGDSHSLAVTEHGALYAWGFNERYQLGTGEEDDETEPCHIPFKSYTILAAGGGGQHTVVLGMKRQV